MELVRRSVRWARRQVYAGTGATCPCCGFRARRFLDYGQPRRPGAKCPSCGALERHRLLALHLRTWASVSRILHVAPEEPVVALLRNLGSIYIGTDLVPNLQVDALTDLTQLPFSDAAFDLVVCSHVLEHVPDDRMAISEIRRVLTTDGSALLMVPVSDIDVTDEDPSITNPEERVRRFGQRDHVRTYGRDFGSRLAEAGLTVEEVRWNADATAAEVAGLTQHAGSLFRAARIGPGR